MRGSRRAVIALVWLLGTGAATTITIEGVHVVGTNVINGENAISPRQIQAALNQRATTTTSAPPTTAAPTTTTTTTVPETTTAPPEPTTEAEPSTTPGKAATTTTTTRRRTTTTTKATVSPPSGSVTPPATTSAPTSPPTASPTNPPTNPPTTSPPTNPPTTPAPTTTAPPPCIYGTKLTDGGGVYACFTPQKVSVQQFWANSGWQPDQTAFGTRPVVTFTKGSRVITVTAYWSGGPQWSVSDTG